MTPKRALNFSTPQSARKRYRRTQAPMRYFGIKPEMKHKTLTIAHTSTTGANLAIPQIAQGTAVDERIGAKVKVWAIEIIMRTTNTSQARFDLLRLNDSTTAPTYTFTSFPDRNQVSQLKIQYLNDGTYADPGGYYGIYRFPMGNICKFTDGTGTTCNSGELTLRTLTLAADTIDGKVKVWYTDV